MAQNWLKQLQATNAQNALNANSQYSQVDADGDGQVTAKELARACDITILEAEEFIEHYDANGDGTLDAQEFEQLKQQILQQQRAPITNEINTTTNYNDLDTNNDGRLSAVEFANACNITVQQATDIIMQYDANGDGMLDANEFETLKQQILAQQTANISNNINANDTHNQFDADGDGRLDAKEFALACNISEQEAQNIIYQYDTNGDGTLDENEFEELKQQILAQQTAHLTNNINANDRYDSIDANNDGRIDAAEFANACNISRQEAQNIISQYDANGDGTLDENEFEELKQQILAQQRQQMAHNMSINEEHNALDADNDGRIDANELATACNISLVEAQNIIAQYDKDGDGKLDEHEFEELKLQILQQRHTDIDAANNPFDEKQEEHVTASGSPINEDVAAYQAAVYDNNQPQMVINNSNERRANSGFVPYNQRDNAPVFSGNINKVNESEYNPNNSDAKAFGVNIFANKKQPNNINNNYHANGSPFGRAPNKNTNRSPFGKAVTAQNNSPFGQPAAGNSNKSPFGYDAAKPKPKPKATMPSAAKPKYAHQWVLGIKFDVKKQQIMLNVSDDTTHKQWRKIVTKQEFSGDIKEEYFRIGRLVNNGDAKYTYPPKGVGAVQVSLSKDSNAYNFAAYPMK